MITMSFREIYCYSAAKKLNLRNIHGTFAAEGMTISKSTSSLDRIASGQISYQQVDRSAGKVRKRGWHVISTLFGRLEF